MSGRLRGQAMAFSKAGMLAQVIGAAVLLGPTKAAQDFKVASVLGSHMVLQQAPRSACIWGTASSRSTIIVQLDGIALNSTHGGPQWKVCLPPQRAGGPHEIKVLMTAEDREDSVTLHDVMFGEVWLCSGQSNMQMSMAQVFDHEAEVASSALYPDIRMFALELNTSTLPLDSVLGLQLPWSPASPQTVNGGPWNYFSGACYLFGRNLYDELKVPIGLVQSAYGSTAIEAWMTPDGLSECPQVEVASPRAVVGRAQRRLRARKVEIAEAMLPRPIYLFQAEPETCYNAMINPLLGMTFRGVIWDQGEQNVWDPSAYRCLLPALINDWKAKLSAASDGEKQLAFGYVQLQGYNDVMMNVTDTGLEVGMMRLVQYEGLSVADTFLIPTYDLNDDTSPYAPVHFRGKQDVGLRLANAALYYFYKQTTRIPYGPALRVMTARASAKAVEVVLLFDGVGEGLLLGPGAADVFEAVSAIDDVDTAMGPEEVVVVGTDRLVLRFPLVEDVRAAYKYLRHAIRNNPCPSRPVDTPYVGAACGVYNSALLPALPFIQALDIEIE